MSDCVVKHLTHQQRVAIRWMHRQGEGLDYFLWYEGVRPWPTMGNLVAKGLVETVHWGEMSTDERGYVRRLTPGGIEIAKYLVDDDG